MMTYHVFAVEPKLTDESLGNIDSFEHDCGPCPLCGSAYVGVMAHHGPNAAWLECFLGHCIEAQYDPESDTTALEITDKPRYVVAFSVDCVFVDLPEPSRVRKRPGRLPISTIGSASFAVAK